MAEIVASFAEKFRQSLVEPVTRPISYMTRYQENICLLREQFGRLVDIRARVKQAVDKAKANEEEIDSDVLRWLIQADETVPLMEEFLEEEHLRRRKTFINLRKRYSRSWKAKKIELEVVKLIEKGKFEGVSNRHPLPVVHQYYYLTDANDAVIKNMKAELKAENVVRIGVFGLEGVGKTRLLQNICSQMEEERIFDKIAWAIVGHKPEYGRMRAQIADELELELEGRGALLFRRLTVDNDVLIILDDVWVPIDLYDLGIPPMHRCKIIITSRDRSILHAMDCEKIWEVKDVDSCDEAWKLFESGVGDDTADSLVLNPFAKQVAHNCGGLPIAILMVARALRGKSDHSIWRDALEQLTMLTDDPLLRSGLSGKTYSSLQLGFNNLVSKEAKSIFLLCSLFPQYSNIPIDYLIHYGLGLRLLGDVGTLMEARNKVYTLVECLKSSTLLMDGVGHEFVRMHAVVRLAALNISYETDFSIFSQAESDVIQLPETYFDCASAISLSLKSIDHFPQGLQCPNPKLLALDCNSRYSSSSRMSKDFFYRMKALNVLHLIEMCELLLPPSICLLENLRILLIECCSFKQNDHLSVLGTLRNLEILSFYGSDIRVLPVEIGQLTGLRMLNLSNCDKLTRIPPHVISRLSSLEGLYMKNSFAGWEMNKDGKERYNLSIGELTSLPLLSELEIHIPDATYFPNDYSLIFKPLHRFDISIGSPFAEIQGYCPASRTTFKFSGKHVNDRVVVLLKKAEAIYLKGLSSYFGEDVLDRNVFLNCRYLEVCNCVGVESFINSRKSLIPKNMFRDHGRFYNMESLHVVNCDQLEFLFLPSTARCLVRLNELKVKRCHNLKQIVRYESNEETTSNVAVLQKLRSLVLHFLPSLVSFSSKPSASRVSNERPYLFTDMVEFPCLEVLSIHGMDQVEVICDDQIPFEFFPKLRSITVVNHTKIPRIDQNRNPGDIFRNLEQLTFLSTPHVSDYLEYYGLRGLRALTLWGRPKLMRRWMNIDSFVPKFRTYNLRELQLWNCSTLRYAISSSTAKLFPQLQTLRLVSCSMVQQVVYIADGHQELANSNDVSVLLPSLKCLILQHLPMLTGFCTENLIVSKVGSSLETLIIVDCPLMKAFCVELSTTTQCLGESTDHDDSQIHQMNDNIPLVPFFGHQVAFPRLVTLKVSEMDSIQKIWDSTQIPTESFGSLKELVVQKCCNLRKVFSSDSWQSKKLPCLEELIVEDCPLVMEVFDFRGFIFSDSDLPLGKMRRLSLIKLPSLKHFCREEESPETGELNPLEFGSLFSRYVAKFLVQLQILEVVECIKVQEIVAWDEDFNDDMHFSRVHYLKLKDLPNLVRFCGGNQSLRWSSLTTLEVERCTNLEMLASGFLNSPVGCATQQTTITSTQNLVKQEFVISTLSLHRLVKMKEIWKDQHRILVFKHLSSLTIHGCERLKTLFSQTIVGGLSQLQNLIVDSCKMIAEIISEERSSRITDVKKIALPQLKTIELKHLPKLASFLSGEYMLVLPLLEHLQVEDCPKLRIFSPEQLDAPNLDKVQTGDSQWVWKGDVESTISHLFNEEVQFSETKELHVSVPDELTSLLDIKLHYKAFRRLKLLQVEHCGKEVRDLLAKLFCRFQELEKFYVGNCSLLKQLFYLEEFDFEDQDKILTTLEELKLWNLPSLIFIWNKEIDGYISLINLKKVDILRCGQLVNLFSPSIARDLWQLQELKIHHCDMIKEVIAATEEGNDDFQEILLPQLQHLELIGLSKFVSFHSGNYAFEWPRLHTLRIERCPRLNSFTPGFIPSPKSNDIDGKSEETLKNKMVEFPSLEVLTIFGLGGICDNQIPIEFFPKLRSITVVSCAKIPTIENTIFRNLEELTLMSCASDDFESEHRELDLEEEYDYVLPRLNALTLWGHPMLMRMWNMDSLVPQFPNLRELEIWNCSTLRYVFSSSTAKQFSQLQTLRVESCSMVQVIADGHQEASNDADAVVLPQLKSLILGRLPNLAAFCTDNFMPKLGSLETLIIRHCPRMKAFSVEFSVMTRGLDESTDEDEDTQVDHVNNIPSNSFFGDEEIWKDQLRISIFKHLSSLTIHGCERMRTLFSPAMFVGGLSQLQSLIVESCKMIKEIISEERSGTTATIKKIAFPQLKTIELKHLPKLVSFLSGEYMLVLPLLDHVRVVECPQMHTFSSGQLDAPNLNGVQIGDSQSEWKGDLESTIGYLFNGEVPFSETKELRISDPDEVIDISEVKLHYKAFRQLKLLQAERCGNELRDLLSKLLCRFQELEKLYVENCYSLEHLFDLEGFDFEGQDKIFTTLEELKLQNLPSLIFIWNKEIGGHISLRNLKKVNIFRCGQLVNLFSPSVVRDLQQLQELKICECDMMEEVIAAKTERGNDDFQAIVFSQLQHLEFIGLSKLMTFHSGNYAFEWPHLRTLRIESAPRLKSLTPGFISTPKSTDFEGTSEETLKSKMVGFPQLNQLYLKSLNDFEEICQESVTVESFTELQVLEIDDCGKLLNGIAHDMLPRLKKLEKLTIKNCQSLGRVFDLKAQIINVKYVGSYVFTGFNEPISSKLLDLVSDEFMSVFGNLQVLKLRDCYRLNNLFLTSIERSFIEFKGQLHPPESQIVEEQSLKEKETVKIDYKLFPKLNFLDLDLSSVTLDKYLDIKTLSEIHCTNGLPAPGQPLFVRVSSFERLEELHLVRLGYFEQIWHDDLPVISLNKLRVLSIEKGEKLLKIVPSQTIVNLLELEKLHVRYCNSLKHVFDLDGITENITGELLPQLTVLVLTHLPEMMAVFSKEPIAILVFQNLRSLRIIHCNSLSSLFSTSTARGLQQLQELKVFGCNRLQVVILDDEKDSKEHMIFPELRCLVLKHLPQLTSFYRGKNTIKWPVLNEVRIKSVPIMEAFSLGSHQTPQLTRIYVTFLEKCWKGDLNETIKFLHKNKKWNTNTEMMVPKFKATSSHGQMPAVSQARATNDKAKDLPSTLKINGSMIVEPKKDKGKEIIQEP